MPVLDLAWKNSLPSGDQKGSEDASRPSEAGCTHEICTFGIQSNRKVRALITVKCDRLTLQSHVAFIVARFAATLNNPHDKRCNFENRLKVCCMWSRI